MYPLDMLSAHGFQWDMLLISNPALLLFDFFKCYLSSNWFVLITSIYRLFLSSR